jgi:hypothetical protein
MEARATARAQGQVRFEERSIDRLDLVIETQIDELLGLSTIHAPQLTSGAAGLIQAGHTH